jgi:drug/metabolite transporter (DMT)-like permease
MNKWWIVSFVLGITVAVEAFALFSIQKYTKVAGEKGSIKYMVIACLIYGLMVPFLLYKMIKYKGVGMVNFLWNIFSTISGFMIGMLLFHEKVNNLQIIGVGLGLLSFALIILGGKKEEQKN